jgi:hypothetical protein
MAKRRAPKGRISFKPSATVSKALKEMQKAGRKVRVVGRVSGGVLQLNQAALAEVARKYPRANMAFVALNAPFKTRALTGSL